MTAVADTILLRPARPTDVPTLETLIEQSARHLSRGFYNKAETAAAIAHVFGVDRELIADETYLVAEAQDTIFGCGGWSRRRTLFGGDRAATREPGLIDPAFEPARIRAFFVAPEAARRGIATRLLRACEAAAARAGFVRSALMATLPGEPFYRHHGYVAEPVVTLDIGGFGVRFVPMTKPSLRGSHGKQNDGMNERLPSCDGSLK